MSVLAPVRLCSSAPASRRCRTGTRAQTRAVAPVLGTQCDEFSVHTDSPALGPDDDGSETPGRTLALDVGACVRLAATSVGAASCARARWTCASAYRLGECTKYLAQYLK